MVLRTMLVAVVALVVMLGALSTFVLSAPGLAGDGAAQGALPAATATPAGTAAPAALPTKAPPPTAAPAPTSVPATPTAAPAVSEGVYVVKEGDTLWSVAQAHGLTVEELMEANDLEDRNYIWYGQKLVIP